MNRIALVFCVSLGLSGFSPALAAPLTFGAINGRDDFSQRSDVGLCAAASDSREGGYSCTLTRTSFGGIPIGKGSMALDARGRVRSVDLVLEDDAYDLASSFLAGRYGKPSTTGGASRWWSGFDDGAKIGIGKSRPNTSISFQFPANHAQALTIDPDIVLSLLIFTLLGLAAGAMVRRHQRADRARPVRGRRDPGPAPLPSMRETLERRMREGQDVSF